MKNPMSYTTLDPNKIEKGQVISTQLDGKYHAEWGEDQTYTIVCKDEDYKRSYDRHLKAVIGLSALHYAPGTYISIGLDHQMKICANSGRQLHCLKGHTDRIQGFIGLNKDKLLSASDDGSLRIWNIKRGEQLAVLEAKISSLDAIKLFDNSEHFAVTEAKHVTIWSFNGEKVAQLEKLTTEINEINELNNGSWLVHAEKRKPGIWTDTGSFVHEFQFYFNFKEDVYQLNQQLLIREPGGTLSLWDLQGNKLSTHESNEKLTDIFNTLLITDRFVTKHMRDHPEVIDYPHLRNPIGIEDSLVNAEKEAVVKKVFRAREEIDLQKVDLSSPIRRQFWNFFNRPLFNPIKTTLKEEIIQARSSIEKLSKHVETNEIELVFHKKKRKSKAIFSWFWFALTLVFGGVTYTAFNHLDFLLNIVQQLIPKIAELRLEEQYTLIKMSSCVGAGVSLLFSMIFYAGNRSHKKQQLQKEENLPIIEKLSPSFSLMISDIKEYRTQLLRKIPVMADGQIFSGEKINGAIHGQIKELEEMALDECGLEREDIDYIDHQAIVLKDWAFIQDNNKHRQVESKLNIKNEMSFWSADGEMQFAVHFIQFIFLTQDKIDVFTTYYDFILGKCIGKEANAFYYKDVTNIAKRAVERNGYSNSKEVSATEITLSVASGEKICLTILNEDSASALVDLGKDNEDVSIEERLERLKKERIEFEEDSSLSEEERLDELNDIDAQINNFKNQTVELDIDKINTQADEAIKNIRAMLRKHKQDDTEKYNAKKEADAFEVIS